MQGSITNAETAINEWTIPTATATATNRSPALLPLEYTPERFERALVAVGVEFRYNYRSLRTQYRRVPFLDATPADWGRPFGLARLDGRSGNAGTGRTRGNAIPRIRGIGRYLVQHRQSQ